MKKKILTFIAADDKMLALYSDPHPEHGEGGWFVVTGGVEGNETDEEAVAREVLEETGLKTKDIMSLNWGSTYKWNDDLCEEHNFISFVTPASITLNEEHSKYEWLDLESFIERVKWDDDKEVLRNVLVKALKKENYFEDFVVKNYGDEDGKE